jgi:hypothetical protein
MILENKERKEEGLEEKQTNSNKTEEKRRKLNENTSKDYNKGTEITFILGTNNSEFTSKADGLHKYV